MEGRKETKASFYVGCPKCSTQIKVEGVFITEVPEQPEPEKEEAKPDAGKEKTDVRTDTPAEGSDLRSANEAAGVSETRSVATTADSGKGKRAKKDGGK